MNSEDGIWYWEIFCSSCGASTRKRHRLNSRLAASCIVIVYFRNSLKTLNSVLVQFHCQGRGRKSPNSVLPPLHKARVQGEKHEFQTYNELRARCNETSPIDLFVPMYCAETDTLDAMMMEACREANAIELASPRKQTHIEFAPGPKPVAAQESEDEVKRRRAADIQVRAREKEARLERERTKRLETGAGIGGDTSRYSHLGKPRFLRPLVHPSREGHSTNLVVRRHVQCSALAIPLRSPKPPSKLKPAFVQSQLLAPFSHTLKRTPTIVSHENVHGRPGVQQCVVPVLNPSLLGPHRGASRPAPRLAQHMCRGLPVMQPRMSCTFPMASTFMPNCSPVLVY